jgi:hypothetical protein
MEPKIVELNDWEYDFLTGQWEGPFGAAYMACFEFCKENGLCDMQGQINQWGREAVAKYEEDNGVAR